MQVVSLRNNFLSAEIAPQIGAGLSRLDWIGDHAPVPVLRGLDDARTTPAPNQLACFPLLPWSNRIGGGGFVCAGRWVPLQPNRAGVPYPIHGDGWLNPWHIHSQSGTELTLTLNREKGMPFSYQARMSYTLEDAALLVSLQVINTGLQVLPFGLGLHPWMPRSDGVMLRAPARDVWQSGADRLPIAPMPMPEAWDFSGARNLPQDGIDHVFSGWDGHADITWPATGIRLRLDADMSHYILYAPVGADFFCFEPVDHLINAHNMPGGAACHGLTLLEPQRQLRRQCRFDVSRPGLADLPMPA